MSNLNTPWEGPINGELQFTGRVMYPDGDTAVIETNLEGLAAIASGLFALDATLTRIADSMDVLNTTLVNR